VYVALSVTLMEFVSFGKLVEGELGYSLTYIYIQIKDKYNSFLQKKSYFSNINFFVDVFLDLWFLIEFIFVSY